MKTLALISLGCSKNLVDSENILGLFIDHGYQLTNDVENADIVLINTCGFIIDAKKESINTILENVNKNRLVIATGCLVERYLDDLRKDIPEVDLYIPIRDYDRFNELLHQLDNEICPIGGVSTDKRVVSTGSFSAYLKIGEGCDNRCTYCAIPLIRGGYRSRPIDDILKEAHKLYDEGYKEIVILQQDTTKYGKDFSSEIDIVYLLKSLLKIDFEYIRLLYLYPDEISDELIDLISKEKRLTPYFDIPIQHSETHILKDMNRRGDKDYLINLFSKIKNKVPNAVLRTSIMVGFPGETSEDVDNLIEFMKEVKFDHLGCFKYSPEEGTPSYLYKNQIKEEEKQKRYEKVMEVQQHISYNKNKLHIGEEMEGIVIGKEDDMYLLRSYWNAPDGIDGKIYFSSDKPLKLGESVKIKIDSAYVYDILGHII